MPYSRRSQNRNPRLSPRIRRWLPIGLALAGLGLLFTVGGFSFAATQEQRDSFCASCHTEPETTHYQRSIAGQPVDLASVHTTYKTRCIDCHSGDGVVGRVQAELTGARNAVRFFTKTAVQPAKLTEPIGDDHCLKCHQTVTTAQPTRNNHFHIFLVRLQAIDPTVGCVSCHSGHATDGTADNRFMTDTRTQQVCDTCHRQLRGGG